MTKKNNYKKIIFISNNLEIVDKITQNDDFIKIIYSKSKIEKYLDLNNYPNLKNIKFSCNSFKFTVNCFGLMSDYIENLDCSSGCINGEIIVLPSRLKILKLNDNSMKILPKLPETLIQLEFNNSPNIILSELPKNLVHLEFSNNNINIFENNYLSELVNLKILKLSYNKFKKDHISSNNHVLPKNLVHLEMSSCDLDTTIFGDFLQHVGKLKYLEILKINNNKLTNIDFIDKSNKSLTTLECSLNEIKNLDNLPENIQVIKCIKNEILHLDNLPQKLKKLLCSYNKIKILDNLPVGLEELDCSYNNIMTIDYLPSSLVKLDISGNTDINNLDNLPTSLKFLTGGNSCVNKLNNLPTNLLKLKMYGRLKLDELLNIPKNIESIIIADKYGILKFKSDFLPIFKIYKMNKHSYILYNYDINRL